MSCNKCARCCQEFSYELNGEELWVQKFVKFLEIARLYSLLKLVKEVKIIIRCRYLDENNLCEIYEKRPERCRDFLCKKARVDPEISDKESREEVEICLGEHYQE